MTIWLYILIPSVVTGVLCAWFFKKKVALFASAIIPWLGVLMWLLYNEYYVPYQGGGASMWPVAQLFAGSVAAITGIFACVVLQKVVQRMI